MHNDLFEVEGTQRVFLLSVVGVSNELYSQADRYNANLQFQIAGISKDDGKPRWCSTAADLFVRSLTFAFWQSTQWASDGGMAQSELQYRDMHALDARDVKAMSKTFGKIEQRHNMMAAKGKRSFTNLEIMQMYGRIFGIEEVWVPLSIPASGNLNHAAYQKLSLKKDFGPWLADTEAFLCQACADHKHVSLKGLIDHKLKQAEEAIA